MTSAGDFAPTSFYSSINTVSLSVMWTIYLVCLFHTLTLAFAQSGVNVPIKSVCHKVISTGQKSGLLKSHDEYPNGPYPPGYQCRLVINVPIGKSVEACIDNAGPVGMRPWDFAIIMDGNVSKQLSFICDVEKYKRLGNTVVQKYLTAGLTRCLKSNTSTIVVDFCVHSFSKDMSNRKGFQITYRALDGPDTPQQIQQESSSEVVEPPAQHSPSSRGVCGKPQNPPSNNPNRIVNGVFARENSWPWICALVQKPSLQFCGCTLIKEQWIVTAGHCVDNSGDDMIKQTVEVYLGSENLRIAGPEHRFSIIQVVRHENYNDPPGSTSNDIALLKLDRAVTISEDVMPACIPEKSVHERVDSKHYASNDRRVCYVAGWGRLYDGQASSDGGKIGAGTDALKQVAIEVMSHTDCKNYMSQYVITEKMFCGGYDKGHYDSCQGDSGGPLVCDDGSGTWNLYGVVSWGLGCAQPRAPGIYTNVALMRDWIQNKTLSG